MESERAEDLIGKVIVGVEAERTGEYDGRETYWSVTLSCGDGSAFRFVLQEEPEDGYYPRMFLENLANDPERERIKAEREAVIQQHLAALQRQREVEYARLDKLKALGASPSLIQEYQNALCGSIGGGVPNIWERVQLFLNQSGQHKG